MPFRASWYASGMRAHHGRSTGVSLSFSFNVPMWIRCVSPSYSPRMSQISSPVDWCISRSRCTAGTLLFLVMKLTMASVMYSSVEFASIR